MNAMDWLNTMKSSGYQPLDLELKAALHQFVLERMEDDGIIFDMSSSERCNLLLPVSSYIQLYLDSEKSLTRLRLMCWPPNWWMR